jgi:DNA invertase Pin-like site-specific DNA recombinase
MNNNLFNVAEYIRLSKDDGDKAESDSVGNQRKLIMDFLKGKDEFVLYDTYVDDGFSGTNFNRPAFNRMMADIDARKVNCVIVKDLSRFGRDYIDTGRYLERYFPDNHIRFISIMDNIDSEKQSYDILMPIKNIFNEQYARDISMKIHASVQTKQRAGEFIGAFAPYGYRKSETDKNKLLIDEYAADVVRRIFSLYINGYGKMRIAGILNEEGIVCPSEYKKQNGDNYRNSNRLDNASYWTYSTINRILQNEMYTGNMVQGRKFQQMRSKVQLREREDWIVVEGTHEAIIDRDTWEKTKNLLKCKTRTQKIDTDIGIFAGFIRCGDCKRALVKKNVTCVNGENRVHYYCGAYVHSGRRFCTPHKISHRILEHIVQEDLRTVINSVDNLKKTVEEQSRFIIAKNMDNSKTLENEKTKVLAELDKTRRLKKNVYEDYREKLISQEECITYREEYARQEIYLKKRLNDLEKITDCKSTVNVFDTPWVKHLLKYKDVEYIDREIVTEMISEIRVYEDNRIMIIYNFSDKLKKMFESTYHI